MTMAETGDGMDDWQPTANLQAIALRARLNALLRRFFAERGVLEVETPVLSQAGNSDPNIISFEIDNLSPTVTIGAIRREGTRFVIAAEVKDGDSAVSRVEYSLDAQRWQSAFPRDGILDGRQESFEIRLDGDANGRTLVLRATDALGNVGSGQAVVR